MNAMKKLGYLMIFIMAFFVKMNAQEINKEEFSEIELPSGVVVDTIVRTDTIVVKEIISRTDIIQRTETVLRYEEKRIGEETDETGNTTIIIEKYPVHKREDNANNQSGTKILNSPIPGEGGNYVWVPDSMDSSVRSLLAGKLVKSMEAEKDNFDPFEKVIFRGDTIPMVLHDRNLGRYDRGLYNFLFNPKGIWQIGLTASYGEFSTSDLEILDLISDIDFSGHIFSIRPSFAYFFKNNLSLGVRLGYTSGKATLGSFNVDIDDDMNFNLRDVSYGSKTYTAAITFSQYLGIARKGRFGVFNEVELALSGGSSDFNRPYNGEMRKTHTNDFKAALNFSPGVSVYVLDKVSFNVSLGVFGLYIRNEKQKVNGVELGHRTTSGANFRFNIFNINFGIAVNI